MTNPKLPRDYLIRSRKRLKAIALLLEEEAFPDVVRESQEVVELLLKAVLRQCPPSDHGRRAWRRIERKRRVPRG
jgi:hypothetical protein